MHLKVENRCVARQRPGATRGTQPGRKLCVSISVGFFAHITLILRLEMDEILFSCAVIWGGGRERIRDRICIRSS